MDCCSLVSQPTSFRSTDRFQYQQWSGDLGPLLNHVKPLERNNWLGHEKRQTHCNCCTVNVP